VLLWTQVMVGSAPASVPCGVYKRGDSRLPGGIVTIVESVPSTASSDATRAVEARLFVVLDDGVIVGEIPTLNDDTVIIVRCFVIFGG
jgi:hypothetical protein